MSVFEPHVFISIGETGALFTLRETAMVRGYVSSFHHCNLSANFDEAYVKAVTFSLTNGIMLKETSKETMEAEMRDITRMTKEQRLQRQQMIEENNAKYGQEKVERNNYFLSLVNQGIMPYGSHKDKKFSELSTSYLQWILKTYSEDSSNNVWEAIVAFIKNDATLMERVNVEFKDEFFGIVGDKIVRKVTVVKTASFNAFNFAGQYETSYVTTMKDEDGFQLVVISPKFKKKEGEIFTLKGKIKAHKIYNDTKQTMIFYAKAV